MARSAKVQRKTNETQIELTLDIDGKGERRIATPVPFFNHMLEAVAKHGLFDLEVTAAGDVDVNPHHTVEDVAATCLRQANRDALGDERHLPLRRGGDPDGRNAGVGGGRLRRPGRVRLPRRRAQGTPGRNLRRRLGREFFGGFVSTALCNLHLEVRYGENAHHMIEALFKAFARATSAAARRDPRVVGVPSTKGTLTS